tara:strand:+ start:8639 stop:9655 length:1017 start_codon:yes stop_codon:yes gene_type:complete
LYWSDLENSDFILLTVYILVSIIPFINAIREKTSIALAMVLSLLLVMFVRFAFTIIGMEFNEIHFFSLYPFIADDPSQIYRFFTSAWLHADFIHVLSNILVIGLVGVPLEQRLGSRRWLVVYSLGFIGGNLAWVAFHPNSVNPAIGASGAAFGLLGAYMVCWPNDEIEFPLLFFIRAWPIWIIVFVRLGLEIYQIYVIQEGTSGDTNIAHMAHVGGFFAAFALARLVARGGPSPLESDMAHNSATNPSEARRITARKNLGELLSDPWEQAGKPLEGNAFRILWNLKTQGDELETRQAWLEELADHTICPICNGEVKIFEKDENYSLICSINNEHLFWP